MGNNKQGIIMALQTHSIVLSNGKTLFIEENKGRLSFITDNHFGSLIGEGFITHNSGDCHKLVDGLGTTTCADAIFDDGEWVFAEATLRPWGKVDAASDDGKAIMKLYKLYKPALATLARLRREDETHKIVYDFARCMEDAFDNVIRK